MQVPGHYLGPLIFVDDQRLTEIDRKGQSYYSCKEYTFQDKYFEILEFIVTLSFSLAFNIYNYCIKWAKCEWVSSLWTSFWDWDISKNTLVISKFTLQLSTWDWDTFKIILVISKFRLQWQRFVKLHRMWKEHGILY